MIAALFVERGIPGADAARFASRVTPCPITGCWWWTGMVDKDGYGRFQLWRDCKEIDLRSHRFAYESLIAPIPRGLLMRHRCDSGMLGCVNPWHLEPGTQAENIQDQVRRGRSSRGERNPASTTTEAQAREVLRALRAGERQIDIGRRTGLSKTVVWQIAHGRAWGWLGGER
jgi:hypothetical protein